MKKALILILVCFTTASFGQTLPNKSGVKVSPNLIDTTLRVLYVKKTSHHHGIPPAYYVDGRLVNEAFIFSIDPNQIDSINIDKGSVQIGNVKYDGQFYLTTKNPKKLKLITLTQLKEKYTNLKKEPSIFTLDGEIITDDYDSFVVDENQLWRIIVDKIEKENINLKVIKLLTKTEENMKKEKSKIRIRGTEVALKE